MFHRRVQLRGEQETDPYVVDALSDLFRAQLQIDAQGLQQVGAAAAAGDRTVAVLGYGEASTCRYECNRSRDVESALPSPPVPQVSTN